MTWARNRLFIANGNPYQSPAKIAKSAVAIIALVTLENDLSDQVDFKGKSRHQRDHRKSNEQGSQTDKKFGNTSWLDLTMIGRRRHDESDRQ